MEVFGIHGRGEVHRFVPVREILDEFRPRAISEEEIQRPIDEHQVEQILRAIESQRTRQSVYTFTVAACEGNRFLVDGQHRLMALRRWIDQREDDEERQEMSDTIHVHIREVPVDSQDEAVRLRDELGMARPVDTIGTVNGVRCQNLLHQFLSECVNPPRSSLNPYYGNWSKEFRRVVAESGFFEHFRSADEMIEEVTELNAFLFEHVVRQRKQSIMDFITGGDKNKYDGKSFQEFREKYRHRTLQRVMCLALVVRYGFMEIILDKMHRGFPDYQVYFQQATKQKFKLNFNDTPSKETEKEVIRRFFGESRIGDDIRKPCPVCGHHELVRDQPSSYHFGHIVSRACGGSNFASNLIPVCQRCNLGCRARNMRDYCVSNYGRDFLLSN